MNNPLRIGEIRIIGPLIRRSNRFDTKNDAIVPVITNLVSTNTFSSLFIVKEDLRIKSMLILKTAQNMESIDQ